MKDVDTKTLAELTAAPPIRDPMHRIISCGKRYINQCGERLSGGNMIVRRALMCAGLDSD